MKIGKMLSAADDARQEIDYQDAKHLFCIFLVISKIINANYTVRYVI